MHSEIKTLERTAIIRDLRLGKFDVLVGINLLREGLDIPEVSLVAILDADKEGFLRSERSLIQTIGRAARNENGMVIMYADTITQSMETAITKRNAGGRFKNGIIRNTVSYRKRFRRISPILSGRQKLLKIKMNMIQQANLVKCLEKNAKNLFSTLEKEMKEAAKALDFERAAELRDIVFELKAER